jgi:hypothetical protein
VVPALDVNNEQGAPVSLGLDELFTSNGRQVDAAVGPDEHVHAGIKEGGLCASA